jgi:hypothetical protein
MNPTLRESVATTLARFEINAADVADRLEGGRKTQFGTWLATCPLCKENDSVLLSDKDGSVIVERNCRCPEDKVRDAVKAQLNGAPRSSCARPANSVNASPMARTKPSLSHSPRSRSKRSTPASSLIRFAASKG